VYTRVALLYTEGDVMTTTVGSTTTITVRLPVDTRKDLEALAKSTGRTRTTLAAEAIERFVAQQRWQIAQVEEGIRAADAGDLATDEQMNELWVEFGLEPDAPSNPGAR